MQRRSGSESVRGAHGREYAGVSSEMWARIPHTDGPRSPEEGSSALGESGPKERPKGVSDGRQAEIPVPPEERWSDGEGRRDRRMEEPGQARRPRCRQIRIAQG